MSIVKGYKVFNPDWTCRGFQYEVGGKYEMNDPIALCYAGFHFCKKAVDCFSYYSFDPNNKVAKVIAYGDIVDDNANKSCTNKIEIVREIGWHEVLDLVNTGRSCTGFRNSGNCNSGDCNSGNYNSGNWNSGNWNSGDWNSGDWNKTSFSNGCFNTSEPKIYLFNKPSAWTYRDWEHSCAYNLLSQIKNDFLEYVFYETMTNEEKVAHPEAEVTGGYLKNRANKDDARNWWKDLSKSDKDCIKSIPNFDADIFEEITGINVNE